MAEFEAGALWGHQAFDIFAENTAQNTNRNIADGIASDIAERGYSIQTEVLPEPFLAALAAYVAQLDRTSFDLAGVGRSKNFTRDPLVRSDNIAWITESTAEGAVWLQWCERLKTALNSRLYLGLFSFESHFARYEPGACYKKHVDAFRGQSNRRLSLVMYLNRDWQASSGGELLLYRQDGLQVMERVLPALGTLVMFLSEEFPHEVLPATRIRHSIAGWFRVNESGSLKVDPPR